MKALLCVSFLLLACSTSWAGNPKDVIEAGPIATPDLPEMEGGAFLWAERHGHDWAGFLSVEMTHRAGHYEWLAIIDGGQVTVGKEKTLTLTAHIAFNGADDPGIDTVIITVPPAGPVSVVGIVRGSNGATVPLFSIVE